MKIKKSYWLWLVLFLTVSPLRAQKAFNVSHWDVGDGLAHNNIYALYKDSQDFLWLGAGLKLQRFDGHNFTTFEHDFKNPNSLVFGDILRIFQDSQDNIWVATDGGGVSKYKSGIFTNYSFSKESNSISSNFVEDIVELPDGSLLFATWGGGINVLKDGLFTHLKHEDGNPNSLSGDKITSLFYDESTETLWIGTWENGLCYMKDGVISRAHDFKDNGVSNITKTNDGTIWMLGAESGLISFKNNQFQEYSFDKDNIAANTMSSLVGSESRLWIGSYGGGFMLYENGKFTNLSKNDTLSLNIHAEFTETSYVDDDGNLWIGTYGEGLTKLSAQEQAINSKPNLQITSISLADTVIVIDEENFPLLNSANKSLSIDPHQRGITITFSDMHYGLADTAFFKYKLSGLNSEWSPSTTDAYLSFESLKPGKYTFEVSASYDKTSWSESISFHFTIPIVWYKTPAFIFAAFLLALTLVGLIIRFRINELMKRSTKMTNLVREKTKEIRYKNHLLTESSDFLKHTNSELKQALDELQSYQKQAEVFNKNEKSATSRELHDNISTRLFSIRQKLNEYNQNIKKGSLKNELSQDIDEMIKHLIGDSQIIIGNLNTQITDHASFYDSLKALINDLTPLTTSQIELSWQGAYHINNLNVASNLFRIIKECLSNCMKYAHASKIKISLINTENMIDLLVEDDGIGFELSQHEKSRGLTEIYRRTKALKAQIMIKTNNDIGTQVRITAIDLYPS